MDCRRPEVGVQGLCMKTRFSPQTIAFLKKASRQKKADWLDKNREEYERVVQAPLQNLAASLKASLARDAIGYHFPIRGLGRLKRPAHRVADGGMYKSWLSYSVSRPSESRFDHNPNLYFMIDPWDKDDPVLVAGGLYMPSSRQLRAVREAIARDATAFDRLFKDKEFARCFKGGFSTDKIAKRPPRGFEPEHPMMHWLKLQAFFVWRPYTMKEFRSERFPEIVARDWKQILRLNVLLGQAIEGRAPAAATPPKSLTSRLDELEAPKRAMDF